MNNQALLPTSTFTGRLARFTSQQRAIAAIVFALLIAVALSANCQGQATSQPSDPAIPAADSNSPSAQPGSPAVRNHDDNDFVIGSDDVLSINVWNEPNLTREVTVRSDGKISLPLVGEMQAAGRTPAQLDQDITMVLRSYVTDPQVTVIVQLIKSQTFNILGQVGKPGSYPLTSGTSIVDAIALAGGLGPFAKKKGIYILRPSASGEESKIGFNYQSFIKGKNIAQNIKVRPHDTIVVP